MGLLSKIKNAGGLIRNKAASAIGRLKQSPKIAGALGKAGKVVGVVARVGVAAGKFAFKRSPIGTALTVGAVGITAAKYVASKIRRAPAVKQEQGIIRAESGKSSLGSKVLKGAAAVAAGGAVAYGVEQVAEAIGVRGGAGFIGRNPKKRKKSTRRSSRRRTRRRYSRTSRRRRSRSHSRGRRVSFTTKDGRHVSFTPGRHRRRRSHSHSRGRITRTEERAIERYIRGKLRN